MGTISPLPSIYSFLPKISCAHVWQNCAHARNHHPYNFALRRSLVRGYCLPVYVKRDPTVSVPQKLLHGFDVLSVCLQQRAEGVAKGMPTNDLGDTGLLRNRLDVPLHEIVRPIGLLASHGRTGENPIRTHRVGTLATPAQKILRHVAVHWDGFGGCLCLAVAHDLMPDGPGNAWAVYINNRFTLAMFTLAIQCSSSRRGRNGALGVCRT